MASIIERLQHGWNAFMNKDPTPTCDHIGAAYGLRPDRMRYTGGNERSIATSIFNRIALDVASVEIAHVRLDDNNNYVEDVNDGIHNCLQVEANIDQSARAFIQDVAASMFDDGVVAIVPIDTSSNIYHENAFDVFSMRTGRIIEWFPQAIRVKVYNDRTGRHEELIVPKQNVAIIENPFYAIMNEPNSTLQRLKRKLALLDRIDSQVGSNKLDLLIQMPYSLKSKTQQERAKERQKEITDQLTGSEYGIAYIDATEKVTQLNRSIDNNLLNQIEYLYNQLMSQLGITQSIMDGTADVNTMNNYYNRTVEPVVAAIVDELKRKFLTQTARSRMQTIKYFRDPFKLIPISDMSDIFDKLTRNAIATSNEMRQIIGWKPRLEAIADELSNKNLSQPTGEDPSENQNEEEYQDEV